MHPKGDFPKEPRQQPPNPRNDKVKGGCNDERGRKAHKKIAILVGLREFCFLENDHQNPEARQ